MPRRVLKLPVVLKRTVPGLGRAGDTVEVAHGRARNELFPRGLIEYKYTGRPPPKKGLVQIGTLLRTAPPLQTGSLTARNAPTPPHRNTHTHTLTVPTRIMSAARSMGDRPNSGNRTMRLRWRPGEGQARCHLRWG